MVVVLDLQKRVALLRGSRVWPDEVVETPRTGAFRRLPGRVMFHVETNEGILVFQQNLVHFNKVILK